MFQTLQIKKFWEIFFVQQLSKFLSRDFKITIYCRSLMRSHGIFLFETFLCKTYRPHPLLYKLLSHLGWIHTCIYNSQVPQSWLGISWWFFGAMWNYSRVGNEMAVKMHQLLNLSFICLCIHLIFCKSAIDYIKHTSIPWAK